MLTPEKARGVTLRHEVNWDAIRHVINTTQGSGLQKRVFGRRFEKAIREHGIEAITPEFRYHYVASRLLLGDYSDYWGWEFRGYGHGDEGDGWAASMYWDETWMAKWGGGNVERLLVLGEGGIGDEVLWASMLPECSLRANEVIYECDSRLITLLERSFPYKPFKLRAVPRREFEDRRTDYGPIDAFIPAADLMRMFRRHRTHFPGKAYLKPDPKRVEEMEQFRGRVGLSWQGRQGGIPVESFCLDSPVSLQYDSVHKDAQLPGIDLRHDIEGVVALCSVLKRVVTVPTSVMHFAGAAGAHVEVVIPEEKATINQVDWSVPPGKVPWYPDVTVYRNIEEWRRDA